MTNKELSLKEEIQQYSTQVLRKVAKQYDQEETYPATEMKDLFNKDVLRLLLDVQTNARKLEEFLSLIYIISTEFAAVGSILLTQATAGVIPMNQFATDQQKDRYLEAVTTGQRIASFALGERDSGSNLARIQTVARETERGWVLEGEKVSISNAAIADIILVVAKIEDKNGNHEENDIGIFIVDSKSDGLEIGLPESKMGINAMPVSNINLYQVEVNSEALLGQNRQAASIVEKILNYQRLMIASQSIGISQGAMNRGLEYVTFDRRFGQRLIDLQDTQYRLAEVETMIEAARAFVKSVARSAELDGRKISMIKLMTSDMAIETTETIMQVTGGYAYMRNNEIERFVRDAKITAIYGGSSKTQKHIISKTWVENGLNGGE